MPKTIYKTYKTNHPADLITGDNPEDFTDAEYRQLSIRSTKPPGARRFIVEVQQGWWNQAAKKPILHRTVSSATFTAHQEAKAALEAQLRYLATIGFVHSFTPIPIPPDFAEYEQLD